jgi:hypothetical protein
LLCVAGSRAELAAAWEHLVTRTRPPRPEIGVLVAALTGLVLIGAAAGHGSVAPADEPALGLILAVADANYAATTVLGHTLAQRVDSVALTTRATAVGAVALAPFLGIAAATSSPVPTCDPARWDCWCTSGSRRWPSPTDCCMQGCGPRLLGRDRGDPGRAAVRAPAGGGSRGRAVGVARCPAGSGVDDGGNEVQPAKRARERPESGSPRPAAA